MIIADLSLLAPAAALALWSLVVLFWMMARRGLLFRSAGITLGKAPAGARGTDLEVMTPGRSEHWVAHNYAHLMEQPTLFYALAVILALAGGGPVDLILAWTYTVLRVVHSLWQGTINTLPVRASLFILGTLVLVALAIRAVALTISL